MLEIKAVSDIFGVENEKQISMFTIFFPGSMKNFDFEWIGMKF